MKDFTKLGMDIVWIDWRIRGIVSDVGALTECIEKYRGSSVLEGRRQSTDIGSK
jgi:hypothetical protein